VQLLRHRYGISYSEGFIGLLTGNG